MFSIRLYNYIIIYLTISILYDNRDVTLKAAIYAIKELFDESPECVVPVFISGLQLYHKVSRYK